MKHDIIHRDPLVGPVAAFFLVVAAIAPIWVVILVAVALAWMKDET